jgi:hypothetical protein
MLGGAAEFLLRTLSPVDVIVAVTAEEYRLPERMAEIIAEHLVTDSGTEAARSLARKIEKAAVDTEVRTVNLTKAEQVPLRRVLSRMSPPHGFSDTDDQRLLAALRAARTES